MAVAAQGLLLLLTTLPYRSVGSKWRNRVFASWSSWISPTCILLCPGKIFLSRLPQNSGRWNKSWARRLNLSGPQHENYSFGTYNCWGDLWRLGKSQSDVGKGRFRYSRDVFFAILAIGCRERFSDCLETFSLFRVSKAEHSGWNGKHVHARG